MNTEPIPYFIYARKSTESDGRQVLSISAQLEEAQKTQERENLNIGGIYSDSKSAKIPNNRPEYTQMIKMIKRGKAAGLIVWKIDRLSRNHLESGELIHLLQTGVIKSIWTPQREYRSTDSALLISLEASMASQYSVDLSENVKRGLDKKLAMGQPPLIARNGYLNTKFAEHGTNSIIVDKKRWPLMRKAFDLMLTQKYSMAQICSILNDELHFRTRPGRKRPGGPLSISMLHRAFTDPFYSGYFRYKGKLHKGSYKPMITIEEFDDIQIILGRKDKPKPQKHDFAFTGFIKCGSCGCAVTASKKLKKIKSTGEYKTYSFYHCTKRRGSQVCAEKRYTKEAEMIDMIESLLQSITLVPLFKEWMFEAVKEQYADEILKQQALLKQACEYEQKLLAELDTMLDMRISNELTDEKYHQKKAERELQIIRVQEKHKRIKNNLTDWIDHVSDKLNFGETAAERFKTGDAKLRKMTCMSIGWNWVLKGNKLYFTRQKWFDDLSQLSAHHNHEKLALEPVKTFTEYRRTASYKAVHPLLCSLRENSRTDK